VDVNPEDKQVEMWLRAKVDIGHVSDGEALILNVIRTAYQAFQSERLLFWHPFAPVTA
jgi:hypothetical protein